MSWVEFTLASGEGVLNVLPSKVDAIYDVRGDGCALLVGGQRIAVEHSVQEAKAMLRGIA